MTTVIPDLEIIEHLDFDFHPPCGLKPQSKYTCNKQNPAAWRVYLTHACEKKPGKGWYLICDPCLQIRLRFGKMKCGVCGAVGTVGEFYKQIEPL
jgi:hypothetical protein